MFTESSNYYSYTCAAGCGTHIYIPNVDSLSHNHVSTCTTCLHGTSAFQYEAEAATSLQTICDNVLNSAIPHNEELNTVVSGFPFDSSLAYTGHQLVPELDIANGVINNEEEISKQYEDERINSWLCFNHDGESLEHANNSGLSYANIDQTTVNIPIYNNIEYNQLQPYSFVQACNETGSIMPVQSLQAVEQPTELLNSISLGVLEGEAFEAGLSQTPSSWWNNIVSYF